MIPADLERLLCSAEGDAVCRMLRDVHYEEEEHGRARLGGEERRSVVALAREQGLLAEAHSGLLVLTDLGYEVANFAKEYCNWIDTGRALPEGVTPELIAGKRVLDVGSSFGRHLATINRHGARGYGIDLQRNYLALSRVFARREDLEVPRLLCGRAESLPVRSGAFDVVLCRLVLNYVTDLHGALDELARVLAPGGHLVLNVGTLRDVVRALRESRWRGNGRTTAWRAFGFFNTLLLELTGRQLAVRARGRMYASHSPTWPRPAWLHRQLVVRGIRPLDGEEARRAERSGLFRAVRR